MDTSLEKKMMKTVWQMGIEKAFLKNYQLWRRFVNSKRKNPVCVNGPIKSCFILVFVDTKKQPKEKDSFIHTRTEGIESFVSSSSIFNLCRSTITIEITVIRKMTMKMRDKAVLLVTMFFIPFLLHTMVKYV